MKGPAQGQGVSTGAGHRVRARLHGLVTHAGACCLSGARMPHGFAAATGAGRQLRGSHGSVLSCPRLLPQGGSPPVSAWASMLGPRSRGRCSQPCAGRGAGASWVNPTPCGSKHLSCGQATGLCCALLALLLSVVKSTLSCAVLCALPPQPGTLHEPRRSAVPCCAVHDMALAPPAPPSPPPPPAGPCKCPWPGATGSGRWTLRSGAPCTRAARAQRDVSVGSVRGCWVGSPNRWLAGCRQVAGRQWGKVG